MCITEYSISLLDDPYGSGTQFEMHDKGILFKL